MSEPRWLTIARGYIGVREIPGVQHSPTILRWLKNLKLLWADDETPWCGVFVGQCMAEAGIPPSSSPAWARSWLNWGIRLSGPEVGCIVVYERGKGGHVGFVVGRDQHDNLMTLGGNQGDRVSIAPFPRTRVLGYRWPAGEVLKISSLPLVGSDGKISTNEA